MPWYVVLLIMVTALLYLPVLTYLCSVAAAFGWCRGVQHFFLANKEREEQR